jgi:DNA-binding NtrC family response regulator
VPKDPFGDLPETHSLSHVPRRRTRERLGLRLAVVAGPDEGATAAFATMTVIVGRAATADFKLTDPTVSAFHTELVSTAEGGIEVRDLHSRNGTLHAGASLRSAIVPPGAVLQLGATLVQIELDAPFEPAASNEEVFGECRGTSRAMREVFASLARLAQSDLSVLIEGPTGTGKEIAARAVHGASRRASGPFIVLDCTAIPSSLAESLLFGHEKGAFTGANERRAGMFESANGGTIFLDEVGELPVELQPKLLRVLERREIVRVGSTKPHPVNVRVVAATWRDLRALTNEGRFREDLYYRLAQARVVIPPLSERPEDIPLLVAHFLATLPADQPGARAISPEALALLERREFAGNVRELRSTLERAAVIAEGSVITPADLLFERRVMGETGRSRESTGLHGSDGPIGRFRETKRSVIDEFERAYLERLIARTGGNVTRAAAIAGVERHYLRNLLRRQGLRPHEED